MLDWEQIPHTGNPRLATRASGDHASMLKDQVTNAPMNVNPWPPWFTQGILIEHYFSSLCTYQVNIRVLPHLCYDAILQQDFNPILFPISVQV